MAEAKPTRAVLGGTAIRPKERHGFDKIKYLIYNSDTGEIFTRTPKSWALITIFYLIYYTCLAAFWAAMLAVFLQTLPDDGSPKWQGANGIIGESPGLGMRPNQSEKYVDSSMIGFNKGMKLGQDGDGYEGWGEWVLRIDSFLETYKKPNAALKTCSKDDPAQKDEPCSFDLASLGPCSKDNYGFDSGNPCVFLKLNKIFGLQNTPFKADNLPEEMPEGLKSHIGTQANKDMVWVDCQPEYPADQEGLASIEYYPKNRGFPSFYFPYTGQEDYMSPLVAVQFKPKKDGQLLHIECRAWAQNIGYSKRDRIGIVHFEILRRS